jgi:hypothetical protein
VAVADPDGAAEAGGAPGAAGGAEAAGAGGCEAACRCDSAPLAIKISRPAAVSNITPTNEVATRHERRRAAPVAGATCSPWWVRESIIGAQRRTPDDQCP